MLIKFIKIIKVLGTHVYLYLNFLIWNDLKKLKANANTKNALKKQSPLIKIIVN